MRVHDITRQNDYQMVVYEYCEVGDLSQYLAKKKEEKEKLDEHEVFELFTQVVLGLDYMHYKRVINKNLRTEHVYLKKRENG